MAWTTPTTRIQGELITPAIWNVNLVDNLNFLRQRSSFSVGLGGNQTIATSTPTKLALNTETFDTNSDYDAATNYRHTPTVAGKYLYVASAIINSTANYRLITYIYKNGASVNAVHNSNGVTSLSAMTSSLQVMNGSSDYVEFYVYQDSGSNKDIFAGVSTYAFGILVERT